MSNSAVIDETANTAAYPRVQTEISEGQNAQARQQSQAEELLANWREQVKTENLAQHTTWRHVIS